MGKHSEPVKTPPKPVVTRDSGELSGVLIIRLIVAALLFAVAMIVKMPSFVKLVLLILAAAVAGYDVALDAVDAVERKEYFATPVLIIFVTVLSFIGYAWEGVAVIILFKVALALISYASEQTKKSARELLRYQDESTADRAAVLMEAENAGNTELVTEISSAASFVLMPLVVIALLYAILVPIISSLTFGESIHRALIMLVVATPLSVVTALPLSGIVGLGYSAQYGVLFNNARTMEKTAQVDTAIFDKNGVFSDSSPRLISAKSNVLDDKTFMDFVSHAVYYSEQPFAKVISAASDQEYRLDLISDFVDIPGSGVDLKIGGAHVTLATRELYASRGEAVPYEAANNNTIYYLMVSDKYIGKVVFSDDIHEEAADVIPELKEAGIEKCILLAEDGKDESERLGTSLNVDEVYAECDTDKKIRLIENLSSGRSEKVMYVYSSGIESHSACAVDFRVSTKGKYADALINPDDFENFPATVKLCGRVLQIIRENAVFAMLIKALLIFLAMIGRCSIWFAIFLDMAAALATILNTIRVTKDPLVDISKLPFMKHAPEDNEE